jgi:putative molybdopterin biosynthesis protein
MDETFLYQQIAEDIRSKILEGQLKPGERLPSVRGLCEQWNCTPGTIQRAYNELAREGLLISRAGKGTQVAGIVPQGISQAQGTLRLASLVNRTESFLLETLTSGYDLHEVQQAMDMAMDRWRAVNSGQIAVQPKTLRFCGSHDMLLNDLAHTFFGKVVQDVTLELTYNGSLGGLMALAEGRADLAGCHLWDVESDSYNLPFIRRLLPGMDIVTISLANRRMGLIVAPGNPLQIDQLVDLARPGVQFINRQQGSGTRVWLDAQLRRLSIDPRQIAGFKDERMTHSAVARAVAEGKADAGLGLETAAQAYGLSFVFLNLERYDLVMLAETARQSPVQQFVGWLVSAEGKQFVDQRVGYDSQVSGQLWTD